MSGQLACEWTREFCLGLKRTLSLSALFTAAIVPRYGFPSGNGFTPFPTVSLPEHLTAVRSSTSSPDVIQTSPARVSESSTCAGNVSVLAIAERAALGNTMCDAPARHDLPDGISAARWFHGPLHLTFTRTVAQWLSEDEDEEDSLSPFF